MEERLGQLLEMYKTDEPMSSNIVLEIKQIRLALKTIDSKMADFCRVDEGVTPLYIERNTMPTMATLPSKVASSNRILSRVAK